MSGQRPSETEEVGVRTEVGDYVRRIVETIGGVLAPAPDTRLFDVGMTSMACVRIMVAVEAEFDVLLPDDFLTFDTFATPDALTDALCAALPAGARLP